MPLITSWRIERIKWLRSIGSDQWSDDGISIDEFVSRVTDSIERLGSTWIAEDAGVPVGTIAVDSEADEGLWTDDELKRAYVVHRMIVPPFASGKGVGTFLLNEADRIARENGKERLVLDAWDSSEKLHTYYRNQGFEYIRTLKGHWTPSATLFQRECRAQTSPGS